MAKLTATRLAKEIGMLSVGEVKALKSVAEYLPEESILVNIGAGVGTSAMAMLEMAPDGWVHTVDKSEEAIRREYKALKETDLNLRRYVAIISDSIQAARGWPEKNIDLLFVDGKHTYEYVRQEIEAWAPFVKDGGFIFFHDYGVGNPAWEQVKQAVDEWREQEQIDLFKRERILVAVHIPSWGRYLKRHEMQYYVDLLRAGEPFGFARYGDGEWRAILGEIGGHNSNGCTFTQELSDALRQVLRNNLNYEHSLLRIARDKIGTRIGKFLLQNMIEVEWTIGNLFLDRSLAGRLWPLIAHLRQRKIIYVGPEYMKPIKDLFFHYEDFITIPPIDAYKEKDRIITELFRAIDKHDADFVGFSSGHHTHLFADELWQSYDGQISFIDFGSIWDGYLNRKSRSYIRKGQYDWDDLLEKNTRGKKP